MKRIETIKNKELFNNIIRKGNFKKNNFFVIYKNPNEDVNVKFGIAISKKFGHAVDRNRIKRQTRSIIDNNRNLFQKGFNYIIMVRKDCKNKSFNALENSLKDLLK